MLKMFSLPKQTDISSLKTTIKQNNKQAEVTKEVSSSIHVKCQNMLLQKHRNHPQGEDGRGQGGQLSVKLPPYP